MSLKTQLTNDMKDAMRTKQSERLGVIRLVLAAIKQIEVDKRIELDDAAVLAVIEKQIKQRKESIRQFSDAGRDDLVVKEQAEIDQLQPYMPEPLSDAELDGMIDDIIAATGAASIKDMGKVMGQLKGRAAGRVDMGTAGARIKARLG